MVNDLKKVSIGAEAHALAILSPLGALTIDMCEAIRRGNAERLVYCAEDAVLMYHRSGIYMLWCNARKAGEAALGALSAAEMGTMNCCLCHGASARDALQACTELIVDEPCLQFYRNSNEKLPLSGVGKIRRLEERDLPFLNANYDMEGEAHNAWAVREGLVFGLELDGEIAAFIGMHPDGSSGMLKVMPAFRRRGLGTELESYLHNLHIERGWVCYGHVFIDNAASLGMQAKFGLEKSSDFLYWSFKEGIDPNDFWSLEVK